MDTALTSVEKVLGMTGFRQCGLTCRGLYRWIAVTKSALVT